MSTQLKDWGDSPPPEQSDSAPSMPIVGYGIESTRKNARQPMTDLFHNVTVKREAHLFIPLVRLPDAQAVLDAERISQAGGSVLLQGMLAISDALRAERDELRGKVWILADAERNRIPDRERSAADVDHTIALAVEEQTHALQVTQAELRKIIAVQLKGLQAVAMLRKRCPITRWNDLPAPYIGEFIDAAIAIDGGEALPVAGVSP